MRTKNRNQIIMIISIVLFFILNLTFTYFLKTNIFNRYLVTFKRSALGEFNALIGDFSVLLLLYLLSRLLFKTPKKRLMSLVIITFFLNLALYVLTIYSKYYGTAFSFYSLSTVTSNPAPELAFTILLESLKEFFIYYRFILFIPSVVLLVLYLYYPKQKIERNELRVKPALIMILSIISLMVLNLTLFNMLSHNWTLNASRSTYVSQNIGTYSYYVYELMGEDFRLDIKDYYEDEQTFYELLDQYDKNKGSYVNYIDNKTYSNVLKIKDTNQLELKGEYENAETLNGIFEDKNLILIHLESFNYFLYSNPEIGQHFSFLNGILEESYVVDNFYTNVGIGTSSDAEFSVLTGLNAPGDSTIYWDYSKKYNDNLDLYAIPKYFKRNGYYTESLHADRKVFYNRDKVHPNMLGFDKYYALEDFLLDGYDNKNYQHDNPWISDKGLIEELYKTKQSINGPYMLYPITMMPHTPFEYDPYFNTKNELIYSDLWESKLSKATLKYIKYAKYYNEILKSFFIDEKTGEPRDLKDDILIFYGDHGAGINKKDLEVIFDKKLTAAEYRKNSNQTIAFIYAQGEEKKTLIDGSVVYEGLFKGRQNLVRSQIDLYRTIIELFSLDAQDDYYFGVNLLSKEPTYSIDSRVLDIIVDDNLYPLLNSNESVDKSIKPKEDFLQYVYERKKLNDYILNQNLFSEMTRRKKNR